VLGGVCVTLLGALWLRLATKKAGLRARLLAVNGVLYLGYLGFELLR